MMILCKFPIEDCTIWCFRLLTSVSSAPVWRVEHWACVCMWGLHGELSSWHGMGHRRPSSVYSMAQYSTVHVYKVTLHLEQLPVDSEPVPGVLAPTPATPSSEASWWTRCWHLHYYRNWNILCFEKVSSNPENCSLFYFSLLISMELIWESKTN